MKKYLFTVACFALLSLFLACQRNINDATVADDFNYPDYAGRTTAIDSKINISIVVESEKADADIALAFFTEKVYPSAGYQIIGGITRTENVYKIYLKDIGIPEGPAAAVLSYAYAKFTLSKPAPGNYGMDIYVDGHLVKGVFTVTRDSYTLTIRSNDYIGTANETINRIPQNLIWGQAESIKPAPYQAFLDSLTILGAQQHNLQTGDYYFFKIDPQRNIHTNSALGMTNGGYFIYTFPGDTILIRNLVKRFAKRYADSIFIQLVGSRGERYYSTVLKKEP
ncbi:MAG TPA: hypothetical protein PLP19_01020 [bacterium]|nr:hypothetical protein [bacterium]HPN42044.1 hypothetical protein [bacterium]